MLYFGAQFKLEWNMELTSGRRSITCKACPWERLKRKLPAAVYPVAITYGSANLDVLHCSLWWFMRLVCFLSDCLHNRILKPGSCLPNPFDPLKTRIKSFWKHIVHNSLFFLVTSYSLISASTIFYCLCVCFGPKRQ